jgi:hypothetical protein
MNNTELLKGMKEMMDANQAKVAANVKTKQETLAKMIARTEDNNEKFEVLQRTLISQIEAWITDTKDSQKERTACQEAMEANPKKAEPHPVEVEAIMERQEIPNEEAAIHSPRACQKETMSCQLTMEACLDSKVTNLEDMESKVEHREVLTEELE